MTDTPAPSLGLVLDCADPERLAEFWASALGYVSVGTFGSYVPLFPNGRGGPKLLLQRVPEPKSVKNRMHLDIEVADIHTEADRLVALGATKLSLAPCSETAPRGCSWPTPRATSSASATAARPGPERPHGGSVPGEVTP